MKIFKNYIVVGKTQFNWKLIVNEIPKKFDYPDLEYSIQISSKNLSPIELFRLDILQFDYKDVDCEIVDGVLYIEGKPLSDFFEIIDGGIVFNRILI